jgi:hypothetical protein
MPKGQSTLLGRILAGSPALIAHNAAGHALFVAYQPPARHVSHILVASCQQVGAGTGTPLLVLDRAGNAVAIARACAHQGWGVLSMLDDHEQQGLERCEAPAVGTLEEGTPVYSGQGKVPRHDAPRPFVIGEPSQGTTLV